MSDQSAPQPGIYVEETHAYTVSLGRQTIITWAQETSLLTVRVQLPYDGQLRFDDGRLLKDMQAVAQELSLGHVEVVLPGEQGPGRTFPIVIPAGEDLAHHLKGNKWVRLPRSFAIEHPGETLVAVAGEIFDGASLDPDQLRVLLFNQGDEFVNHLRLHLSFWVPDLFATSQQSRERELHEMLLQRESARQIFIPSLGNEAQLAEGVAALANASGGRILLGVDERSQVIGLAEQDIAQEGAGLKLALLRAALRSTPAVAFFSPDYFRTSEGKTVARVVVPEGLGAPHQIDGKIVQRGGAASVSRVASPPPATAPAPSFANLELALKGEGDDVVILDAGGDLGTLEIGPSICALINAGKRDGLILIRNMTPTDGQKLAANGSRGTLRQLEERVEQEVGKCLPPLALRPALARVSDEQVGVLRVSSDLAPIALYDGAAYDWHSRALRSISIDDAFDRFLRRQRVGSAARAGGDRVHMVYGELGWPIQPPPGLRNGGGREDQRDPGGRYDIQRRAVVWGPRQFVQDRVTSGWRCALTTPLHQALMDVGSAGDTVQSLPELRGQVLVRINDLLASGADVRTHASSKMVEHLPIHRRTNLRLQLSADPQELFARRRRMSLLRFRLPDVPLSEERVADVRQACADLGFRISAVRQNELQRRAMIEGIRSEGYCDIALLIGMVCERTSLTRALQYEQRIDSKTTQSAELDIRVALWGMGDAAAATIARLHMELHHLLHQRLFYLGSE